MAREMKFESFADMAGNTPLVRAHSDGAGSARIWIKLEGQNPTGSVKDRACLSNIRDAVRRGTLEPGKTILDASSGNMACSLAYFGRLLGYQTRVVCSAKLTDDKAEFITYFGGQLTRYGEFTFDGSQYCREHLCAEEPNTYCFLDQLHNWANPQASYETMGPEILNALPNVSMVVASLGSGGTLLGTARFLKERRQDTKTVAVQAASGTKIPGTGSFDDGDYETPFIKAGYADGMFDHTVKVSIEAALRRTEELSQQGFFVGFQTGGVFDAALTAIRKHDISGDVVVISGDAGWKNMKRLLNA